MKTANNPVLHILCIVLLAMLIYGNTLNAPFQLDDKSIIVHNPLIKDLRFFLDPDKAAIVQDLFQSKEFRNRPIGMLSFALNYAVHGLNVQGYHVVNIVIHTTNACIVYWLIFLLLRTPVLSASPVRRYTPQLALFIALLFVVHPLQTGAVTYVWQRVTSLATLFYLLSLSLYIRCRIITMELGALGTQAPRHGISPRAAAMYLLALVSAVLGMKTKQIVFTLPAIIVLVEFMFFEGSVKKRAALILPFLFTLLIVPASQQSFTGGAGGMFSRLDDMTRDLSSIPRSDYLFTQFRVIMTYIRLLVFPVNQNLDYDYPISTSFFAPSVIISFITLAALLCAGFYLLYQSRHVDREQSGWFKLTSFGLFFFFITLSVESSIIPIADMIFEHRVYLPSVGFFIAWSALTGWAYTRWGSSVKHAAAMLRAFAVIVIVLFSVNAQARNQLWKDSIRLWEDTVRKSPDKARPHNSLAAAYKEAGRFDEAVREYEVVAGIYPDFFKAHFDLGDAYLLQGRQGEAIAALERARELRPGYANTYLQLANAFARQGRLDDAVRELKTALKFAPDMPEARNNLGNVYALQKRFNEAINEFRIAVRLAPVNADAHFNLAGALTEQGHLNEAVDEYHAVLSLDPMDTDAHLKLAALYVQLRRHRDAREECEAALRIDPGNAQVRQQRDALMRRIDR